MTDLSAQAPRPWRRIDRAWLFTGAVLAAIAVLDPSQFPPTLVFTAKALLNTAPLILVAVLSVGYLKASGAETGLARAFTGNETRMIFMAAAMGGLSPFCSCEVIPFVAAMLALGVPLSAVMAFWLASPLMDPAMFVITAGTLGLPFAIGKTAAALGIGLLGGALTMLGKRSAVFADPLREKPQVGGCCSSKRPYQGKPVWRFWTEPDRVGTFRGAVTDNAVFLLKWLTLAYVLESVMLAYVPPEWIGGLLGGDGVWPVVM